MPVSTDVARARGRVAGYKRAVRNGERAADDPVLGQAERDLAVSVLAEHAKKVVEAWPDLSDEQLGRIATILRGGAASDPPGSTPSTRMDGSTASQAAEGNRAQPA